MTTIKMIWAYDRNQAIGREGRMPWNVPEDLQHFKQLTEGAPIVMGRNTWESLPKKPLPNRENIVITSTPIDGVTTYSDIQAALEAFKQYETVWIIGGAQLYSAFLPYADEIHITVIDSEVDDADTFMEKPPAPHWRRWSMQPLQGKWHTSRTGTRYRFEEWRTVMTMQEAAAQQDMLAMVKPDAPPVTSRQAVERLEACGATPELASETLINLLQSRKLEVDDNYLLVPGERYHQ